MSILAFELTLHALCRHHLDVYRQFGPDSISLLGGYLRFINTMSTTQMLSTVDCHFRRCCNVCKYSTDQRFQKRCIICWVICHRVNVDAFRSLISSRGITLVCSPIKKCPGVNTSKSSGSLLMGQSGREFRRDSPITRRIWCFTDRMADSASPLKCGDSGGEKCHVVPLLAIAVCTRSANNFRSARTNTAAAPTKFVGETLKWNFHLKLILKQTEDSVEIRI